MESKKWILMGLDGMVIIVQCSFKSTFGANKILTDDMLKRVISFPFRWLFSRQKLGLRFGTPYSHLPGCFWYRKKKEHKQQGSSFNPIFTLFWVSGGGIWLDHKIYQIWSSGVSAQPIRPYFEEYIMIDMYESFQYFPRKKAKFGFSLFISLAQPIRTPFDTL